MVEIFMKGPPECPLCYKRMREIITRKGTFYVCTTDTCMVSINKLDPACGRWREFETNKSCLCPRDGTPMRAFFRALDNYKKVQCPKCKAEGRISQVEVGKVSDMAPNSDAWAVDPEQLK